MRVPPGPPMTLANMRQNGVRSVTVSCANCGRSADEALAALRADGLSIREIADRTGVSKSAVERRLKGGEG